MLNKIRISIISFCFLFLAGCTATQINTSPAPSIHPRDTFAVGLFSNHTETPLAGDRATSVTASLLESKGIPNVVVYQRQPNNRTLFPGIVQVPSKAKLLSWARRQGAHYLVFGSVNEWTYKVGLDGEPVVGVTIQLLDAYNGEIIWTGVGSMSGGSRVAVSTVAQTLISLMLNRLVIGIPYYHSS